MFASLKADCRLGALVLFAGLVSHGTTQIVCAQLVVGDSNVGYIDSAIPATLVRLRFDAGYLSRFPDRVEFYYAQFGQPGAPLVETGIEDHQELSAYLEYAPLDIASLFVEAPMRWINPEVNANTGGLYDINAGGKVALWENECSITTAQLRVYIPTGDTDAGLSTGHTSIEPSLLYLRKLSDRLTLEAELRDWIPIDASTTGPGGPMVAGGTRQFAGNVLRYGVGLSYLAWDDEFYTASPVAEFVGWHVLSGSKSDTAGQPISAVNDSITNLKLGLRLGMKSLGMNDASADTIFIGYGVALSDEYWYRHIARVEMRLAF